MLLSSCGSVPDVYVNGREVPNVHSIRSLKNSTMSANFVCVLITGVKDADGSTVAQPVYLQANVPYEIRRVRLKDVHFQMSISNQTEITYQIREEFIVTYRNGDQIPGESLAAISFLKSREFSRKLPVAEEIDTVTYRVILQNDKNEELLRAGDFVYRLL